MEKTVKIKKNGKVLFEISESLYPLEIEAPLMDEHYQWYEKSYTWKLSYWRDNKTWKKFLDKPRGSQLE